MSYDLTFLVPRPEYFGRIRSLIWWLIPWLLVTPGHQQQWYLLTMQDKWFFVMYEKGLRFQMNFKFQCPEIYAPSKKHSTYSAILIHRHGSLGSFWVWAQPMRRHSIVTVSYWRSPYPQWCMDLVRKQPWKVRTFSGWAWIWLDFPDLKHDYIKEVYRSDVCFASHSLRTGDFHGDCENSDDERNRQ